MPRRSLGPGPRRRCRPERAGCPRCRGFGTLEQGARSAHAGRTQPSDPLRRGAHSDLAHTVGVALGSPAALAAAGLEPWAGRAELACRAPFLDPLRRGAHSDLVRDVVVALCAPAALAAVGSVGGCCSVCLALLRRAVLAGTADDSVAPGTCCSVSSLFTFWRHSRPRPPAAPPSSCVQAPSWRLPSTTRSG